MEHTQIKNIIEAAMLAAKRPLTVAQIEDLFDVPEQNQPDKATIRQAIGELQKEYEDRGIELKQVASGYRIQVRQELEPWIRRLWQERPPRYSRPLLETLAIIAYRQPITRGEIEEIRGVSVSTNITRTLQEREWVRVVGHRDVPGKPAMFGTTKAFLDYFNLKSLDELPTLGELKDLDAIHPELALEAEPENGEESSENEESTQEVTAEDLSNVVHLEQAQADKLH